MKIIDILKKVLLLPLCVFITEIIFHVMVFDLQPDAYLFFGFLAALALTGLLNLLASFLPQKAYKIVTTALLVILGIYASGMMVYYHIFRSFFLWNTIGLAKDVTAFYREAWTGTKQCWYMIFAILAVAPLYFLLIRKQNCQFKATERIISGALSVIAIVAMVMLMQQKNNYRNYVRMQSSPTVSYYQYGYISSTGFDITQTLFGAPEDNTGPIVIPDPDQIGSTDVRVAVEKVILKNNIEMDVDALIAASPNNTIKDMNIYFTSKSGSSQNDYTGYFEGKNLIFLSLEGFSYKAIIPELTPTLYKMYTEGFIFTNFYDSIWGGSTATGEYANITGNFYTSASCLPDSEGKFNYSALGNVFKRKGYNTFAFHNGNYGYYSRNKAFPYYGFDSYRAVGSGLKLRGSYWPNSDEELAMASIEYYIDSDKPFQVYYMTISGHTYYTFSGNQMAREHQNEVSVLDYSSGVRAYIATQIEVDLCLKYLVEKLDEAGKLEDTVFAMCADHYPYGLSDAECAELYDLPLDDVRGNLELYRNAFILWSASMEEPIVVDTPCSSYDMLPTLANLFGCEYDSRFITGTDIMAPEEKIVLINTPTYRGGMWNWITSQGTFRTYSETFTKSETCTLEDDQIENYVAATNAKVDAMKKYAFNLFDYDYYKYVFNSDGTPKYPLKQE